MCNAGGASKRLDEYIRSFEERYGAVPIEEIPVNTSQVSSISAVSEPKAGLASVAREFCRTTPRFPSEPLACESSPMPRQAPARGPQGPGPSSWAQPSFKALHLSEVSTSHGHPSYPSRRQTMDQSWLSVSSQCGEVLQSTEMAARGPMQRPDRARAPSNPPELSLRGPARCSGPMDTHISMDRMDQRDTAAAVEAAKSAASAAAVASSQVTARPRPNLELADPLSLRTESSTLSASQLGMGRHASLEDEVNCQSPVHIPQPSKLLRRFPKTETAAQTQEVSEPLADWAEVALCDMSAQTDNEGTGEPCAKRTGALPEDPGSPLGFSAWRGVQSTPDFGEELRAAKVWTSGTTGTTDTTGTTGRAGLALGAVKDPQNAELNQQLRNALVLSDSDTESRQAPAQQPAQPATRPALREKQQAALEGFRAKAAGRLLEVLGQDCKALADELAAAFVKAPFGGHLQGER
ncbi:unnamed protein product [Effrenium voratum]|uniref:Uncharacterized protein n=1 Tax=Effrenium voratum TaxID=2562239 RepID=A0AA36IZZ8_9DINO|nr:unnamed protein product [Effrenium voratum]